MKIPSYLLPLLIIIYLPAITFAQAGTLDNAFGTSGIAITSLGSFGDRGNSLAIQSDGKTVLAGNSQSSFITSDFAMVRYTTNGMLDTAFGTGGKVITPVENNSKVNTVAIQSDGRILLGGYSDWYINIIRYNNNGTLDTTFGTGGKVITDVQGYYSEQCKSIAIQSDGKILVSGYGQHNANDNPYFILIRYNFNGTLDNTFGTGGIVIGSKGKSNSMAVQSDGKILLGGATDFAFALVRYTTNGIADTAFGVNGNVTTPVGTSAEANSLAITSNGKIVLAGYSYNTGMYSYFTIVQYTSNGSLDNTFGTGGIIITPVGSASGVGNSLSFQSDGKILLAGNASNGSNYADFALVRYNTNGTLDNSFGTGGKIITTIGVSYSIGNSLSIDSNGKIMLGGFSYNGSKTDFTIVRYNGDVNMGLQEAKGKQLNCKIFPNPFTTSATIQYNIPLHNAELKIYNIFGKEVKQLSAISGEEIKISCDYLPSGIYFLQLTEENKILSVEKLVITEK